MGREGDTAFVCVEGHGSFESAQHLKSFIDQVSEKGVIHFVFNLEKCSYMDSTFMGILAALSIHMRKVHASVPKIVNPDPRCVQLLHDLGIDHILQIENKPVAISEENMEALAEEKSTPQQISKTMLEAHETLTEVHPPNAVKFKDVLAYLKEEMGIQG